MTKKRVKIAMIQIVNRFILLKNKRRFKSAQ